MARAYGAIPVLRGATLWHNSNPDKNYLAGIVLFSPDLYTEIPQLGLDPEYVPVTRATSIPVMIYQAQNRGTGWQLPRLLETLSVHNENVYYKIMTGVSGIFYRNDLTSETQAVLERLPAELPIIFRLLAKTEKMLPDRNYTYKNRISTSLLDIRLKPYKAHPVARPIRLYDINGKLIELRDYKGQVTLVNFWATWCPPCVHEIPSLNNLKSKMKGKNFQLISINYAETPETVRNFLEQVQVDFPVLMDVDNQVSAQWNVIAFPSTFVVGSDGNIHYGVNAAIEWDDPEIIRLLESL
jgi:peroxiredoxin